MSSHPSSSDTRTLGKYKIIRELGRGAMGVVYEGFDPLLERYVALKTIRKDLLDAGTVYENDNILQRFRREAQAAARLHHPCIVTVYDYAEEGDTVYIAMELVHGKELKDYFAQKHRFEIKTALEIMLQLLDGLAYSHQNNIVHRDIKPANIILIDGTGQVKIADFGIARIDTSELTQAGEVMGTPTYMSPEQLLGKHVDGRADLFSAGVVLFELLTGEKPFTGSNITAVMHSVLTADPPVPSQRNHQLPPECDAIIAKALCKDAGERYQSADEFKAVLKTLLDRVNASAPPRPVTPDSHALPTHAVTEPLLLEHTLLPKQQNFPDTLEDWVEYLTQQEMPIFSHTARRINQAMSNPATNAIELGRIIQQDPTLTAKLLKLGNSVYYNPSRQKLPNVNRAIIILGIKNIHNLALACSYVESVITGNSVEQVNRQIAHSLHAAVQSKSFATLVDDPFPEEVFVASLMNNFGRVAFWCYGKDACIQIRRLMDAGMEAEAAERKVLGFTLDELNVALCKAWQLGGLIQECIEAADDPLDDTLSKRVKLVNISQELVRELANGLDSPGAQECLKQVAELTHKKANALLSIVMDNAEQAVHVASQFGASAVAPYIVKPAMMLPPAEVAPPDATVKVSSARLSALGAFQTPMPPGKSGVDQAERIKILQDISGMLDGQANINTVFEKVVEGIQKAIAMDRVLFALISPNRTVLREKISNGLNAELRNHVLEFDISAEKNIFTYALSQSGASWIIPRDDPAMLRLFTPLVRKHLGQNECFVMPIAIHNKFIGLFYCDRAIRRIPLERQSLNVFAEFVQQANICINLSKK
ncbi:MAG: serine/threonine protein kinase [Methylococcaceae bacterium]|nr:MAG: serine/threonine protein kinase [Methylococcaceae bacterium]